MTIAQSSPNTTAAEILDGSQASQSGASAAALTPPATPAADDRLSPKLQILLQREKAAVQRESAAKAQEGSIAAKLKEIDEKLARLSEFESVKGKNPLKALEMLGFSYEDLTKMQLADGNVTPDVQMRKLEEKINGLAEGREKDAQRQAEAAQLQAKREAEQTETEFNNEISGYLKENADRYELIEFEQAHNNGLIYGVVDEHYNRTLNAKIATLKEEGKSDEEISAMDLAGEVLTIAQACDKVEAHFESKYAKAKATKKGQVLFGALQPAIKANIPPPAPKQPGTPLSRKPQTHNTQTSAQPAATRTRALTDAERVQKAIAYGSAILRGQRPA